MRILAIGDIVGGITIDYLSKNLSRVTRENKIDFVIANGENASEIKGLTQNDAEALCNLGVDFITLGNHAFGKRDLYSYLDSNDAKIIRPANFPASAPGAGYSIVNVDGYKLLIINALGTMYMTPLNSPFETVDIILEREKSKYDFAILDIHAEATSEKLAIAHYFDGRIAIIFGTHTHVQTADEQILPLGSAYITDIGMSGPVNSILGTKVETILESFIKKTPQYFTVADGEVKAHGVIFDINPDTSKINSIKRITF
ncbi:MAG: TIGR00282 family metallophosphoesterase [Eubacteriales bacterium]